MFPPILNSSQPAFCPENNIYSIYFSLSDLMSINEVKHIQIKITKQSNNKSIVRTANFPDGIIYKDISNVKPSGNDYYIDISSLTDITGWTTGEIYKIQMRFGKNSLWLDSFSSWKSQQVAQSAFSEWSTVMVVKAINKPVIEIKNATSVKENVISTISLEPTLTPTFVGYAKFDDNDNEAVNQYRFILYTKDGDKIEDSGWLRHNASADYTDIHRFSTVLINGEQYTVVYQIQSINGYTTVIDGTDLSQTQDSKPYNFEARSTYLTTLSKVSFRADDESTYSRENGCIRIYLTSEELLTGNFIISRSSEKSDFSIWEDIKFLLLSNQSYDDDLIYTDFTIESGIKYKYAIQKENSQKLRTSPLYEEHSNERMINFEYSYLYADGVQIPLKFNNTQSTFKHTVLANKVDTLGSKYPTITRNGAAYYAEFPVNGIISFHLDQDQTFFTYKVNEGYYYKDELIIPDEKFHLDDINSRDNKNNVYSSRIIDTNYTDDNIFIERKFREKVEEFLNDGNYKLFKSPTEGNIIVGLMNVSLNAENTYSRMIYNFSSTAYEVAENTVENLDKTQIINIGDFSDFSAEDTIKLFGQVNGKYIGQYLKIWEENPTGYKPLILQNPSPDNLLDVIKSQVEYSIGENYQYNFSKLNSIWVEQYPNLTFETEIKEIIGEISNTKQDETLTEEEKEKLIAALEEEKEEIESLVAAIEDEADYPRISLVIDDKEFMLGKNKPFIVDDSFSGLTSIYLKYTGPIIINYICEVYTIENLAETVTSIDTSVTWGQLNGIFTSTAEVLRNYNYLYSSLADYQIPNIEIEKDTTYFSYDTNFNLYKSENIFNIIKEKSRKQIEVIYGIDEFINYDEKTDTYDDGSTFYTFVDILTIEIEADKDTEMILTTGNNTEVKVRMGATEKYILHPADNLIKGLRFAAPTYAIINYKCSTMQTLKNKGGN